MREHVCSFKAGKFLLSTSSRSRCFRWVRSSRTCYQTFCSIHAIWIHRGKVGFLERIQLDQTRHHFGDSSSFCSRDIPALSFRIPHSDGAVVWWTYHPFTGRMPAGWSLWSDPVHLDDPTTSPFITKWARGWLPGWHHYRWSRSVRDRWYQTSCCCVERTWSVTESSKMRDYPRRQLSSVWWHLGWVHSFPAFGSYTPWIHTLCRKNTRWFTCQQTERTRKTYRTASEDIGPWRSPDAQVLAECSQTDVCSSIFTMFG